MTGSIPLSLTWYATGNNVTFAADTIRRTLQIKLNSRLENPEERKGFRHPDLEAWIAEQRPRLLGDAPTILAPTAAGRPTQNFASWGSFEKWSDLVRGAIMWAGVPDPAGNRRAFTRRQDSDHDRLSALLDGWKETQAYLNKPDGCSASEVIDRLGKIPTDYETPAIASLRTSSPRSPASHQAR
jgi:hypothetical protein